MPEPINLPIRKGALSDVATLVEFNQRLAQETEQLDLDQATVTRGVENLLGDPTRGFYLVAEENGAIAGSLMVTFEWSDWRNANFWWVQSVYVRKDSRRRGIYRKLYEHVSALAQNSEACGIRLYVEKGNFPAQKSYAQLGMKETYYKVFEMTIAPKPFSSAPHPA